MPDVYTYTNRVAIATLVTLLVLNGFYLLGWHAYSFLLFFSAILLAAPILAVLLVIVNELYINDVLEISAEELETSHVLSERAGVGRGG